MEARERERERDGDSEDSVEEQIQEIFEMAELSLKFYLLVGISTPRTMKLKGTIRIEELVVMIDSGGTHNFISEKVVRRLGLNAVKTNRYGVLTGTGITVQGMGVGRNIELVLQGFPTVLSFIPLELGSTDVILGSHWLETWAR